MADTTISSLSPLSVTSGLLLPVSNGTTTGQVSIANVNSLAPVQSVAGKTGSVTLTNSDVGLGNVENKSSATIRSEITSANVTSALGYTPVQPTSPAIAKAWVLFRTDQDVNGAANISNTARKLVSSYNVSSVTRINTGRFNIVFSPALVSTNCTLIGTAGGNRANGISGGIIVGNVESTTQGWVGTFDDSVNSYYEISTSNSQYLVSVLVFGA